MKRSVLIIFLLCLIYAVTENKAQGQLWKLKRWETVVGLGPSFFFGDIGGYSQGENLLGFKDLSFNQTRFNFNFNIKYRISSNFNARLSLTYAFFHASDVKGSNENRDFEATMSGLEPALLFEYYFIKNRAESSYLFSKGRGTGFGNVLRSLDFYAFTGMGGLAYTIKGNDKLVNYGLDPGGFNAVIPVGVGTTLIYSPNYNFGVEFGGRYSFSDNLDGYTSQYSNSNDVYYFLNFTVTYKLKTGPKGWPSFR
jgi:hypothetical protein